MKERQIVDCYGGVFCEARHSYKGGREQFMIKWIQLHKKMSHIHQQQYLIVQCEQAVHPNQCNLAKMHMIRLLFRV